MYRHLSATKRIGGKVKRYKNLAAFNSECGKRSTRSMASCTATNLRCTKDGGGLATVQTITTARATTPARRCREAAVLVERGSCTSRAARS